MLVIGPAASGAGAEHCPAVSAGTLARIATVVDGDTVWLESGEKVRLIGIDTPELSRDKRPAQPFAHAARQALSKVVANNSSVRLQYGVERTDRYGRSLAHLFSAEGDNIAAKLLTKGLAIAIAIPPNTRLLACYRRLEARARGAGTGIWSHRDYQPVTAAAVRENERGYRFVVGTVSKTEVRPTSVWLHLSRGFAVRIAGSDLNQFKGVDLAGLPGRNIQIRGWIYKRDGALRIRLRHAADFAVAGAGL